LVEKPQPTRKMLQAVLVAVFAAGDTLLRL
jgi:hypothetical protein